MFSCTNNAELSEAEERTKEIDRNLREEAKKVKKELKILLLGPSESGKSTVLKQFRIIFSGRFAEAERVAIRTTIYANVFASIIPILTAHTEWQKEFALPQSAEAAEVLKQTSATERLGVNGLTPAQVSAIKTLWKDASIKECAEKGSAYNLLDSAVYFLDNIDRVASDNYLPTDQDILQSRIITTVVSEFKFTHNHNVYRIFDVGGHRSARKSWAPYFDSCNAILFIVAVSSYNQRLAEDLTVNRLDEALSLFDAIVNHPLFTSTSIILFMNKVDLFAEKVKRFPIKEHFPDYQPPPPEGPPEEKHGLRFFIKKFRSLNRTEGRELFLYETCSTDTQQIKMVLLAVNEVIIKGNLQSAGF